MDNTEHSLPVDFPKKEEDLEELMLQLAVRLWAFEFKNGEEEHDSEERQLSVQRTCKRPDAQQ